MALWEGSTIDAVVTPPLALALDEASRARIERLPFGVVIIDRQGKLFAMNAAGRRISGNPPAITDPLPEQTERYAIRDSRSGRPLPANETPIGRALAGEAVNDFHYLIRRRGESRDALITATGGPIRDASGAVIGAYASFEEVTPAQPADPMPTMARIASDSSAYGGTGRPITATAARVRLVSRAASVCVVLVGLAGPATAGRERIR